MPHAARYSVAARLRSTAIFLPPSSASANNVHAAGSPAPSLHAVSHAAGSAHAGVANADAGAHRHAATAQNTASLPIAVDDRRGRIGRRWPAAGLPTTWWSRT